MYLDGVEEASPSDQLDHTVRQLGHVLPQQLPHPLRVLGQLLLYENLETGQGHLAGQGVTPIGAAMLPLPDVIIIIIIIIIIIDIVYYCLLPDVEHDVVITQHRGHREHSTRQSLPQHNYVRPRSLLQSILSFHFGISLLLSYPNVTLNLTSIRFKYGQ